MLTALLVILILASMTGYLLFRQKQLRLAGDAQSRFSDMLIHAQELERSRLAAELHDDISQRVALLAIDLENATELIANSPQEAKHRLHALLDSIGELGADLHTISRRLHPSTLERLGLIPGVSALCREFEAQQGMQVDFAHENILPPVPSEAALCLFRIVQEGLWNSKKHSGSSNAQVSLELAGDTLHVSVCDQGVGCNLKECLKEDGIGVRTMGQRARMLGGRFEVRSEPQGGTRIDAWVPIQPRAGTGIG